MTSCQLCHNRALIDVLDLGPQPISNRFLADPTADEARFSLLLEQCPACGLAQLRCPPPADELRPRLAWISYNEPEDHLDRLAEIISRLPGLDSDAAILGVSFKDDTLLARLAKMGFRCTRRLDEQRDLGITEAGAGVESIQDRFDCRRALAIGAGAGRPKIIIARHILEHAHDLHRFMEALRTLLAPGGYLVLEVPDCTTAFTTGDSTVIWEEHVAYFTPATFPRVFDQMGQRLVDLQVFPYRLENSLVGIGQAVPPAQAAGTSEVSENQLGLLARFKESVVRQMSRAKSILDERRRQDGQIAILGAGHTACGFINYLGLREQVALVVDTNPHKQGLFMPGSRLPIVSPDALLRDDIGVCLLSVNPDVEEGVIRRNHAFLERGGKFASIFAASSRSLWA